MSFIGAGERTAVQILSVFFPRAIIATQVSVAQIFSYYGRSDELSTRQKKETVDIVVLAAKTIAIRIHGKKGAGKMRAERHQRELLESLGWYVVDIHKRDCPELFAEKFNWKSAWELLNCFADQQISPNI